MLLGFCWDQPHHDAQKNGEREVRWREHLKQGQTLEGQNRETSLSKTLSLEELMSALSLGALIFEGDCGLHMTSPFMSHKPLLTVPSPVSLASSSEGSSSVGYGSLVS